MRFIWHEVPKVQNDIELVPWQDRCERNPNKEPKPSKSDDDDDDDTAPMR